MTQRSKIKPIKILREFLKELPIISLVLQWKSRGLSKVNRDILEGLREDLVGSKWLRDFEARIENRGVVYVKRNLEKRRREFEEELGDLLFGGGVMKPEMSEWNNVFIE